MESFPWRFVIPAYVRVSIWLTNYKSMTMSTTVSELVALVNKLSYEDRQRFIQIVRKLNDASDLSPIKKNRAETDKEELFND